MKTDKVTIYDIAKKAGAAASTVSSALDGSWEKRRISVKTVKRIQTVANEMGFTVNMQARGLRKAKSGLVGMILPEHNNRFFSNLSQSFAAEVRKRKNCPAIISTRRNEKEEMEAVENLISYAIDALFIVGATNPNALSQMCQNANLPHVFVDQPCDLASSVVTDNYFGSKQLTEHLLSKLRERNIEDVNDFYFLGGDATLPASSRRIEGFKDAFKDVQYEVESSQIIACGYDKSVAENELRKLYQNLGRLPNALLVNSMGCFEGALHVLSKLPENEIKQCTIGCFDYDPFGVLLRFPVHMVRQRANELIKVAYGCIETHSESPKLTLVKPELITT